MLYDGGSPHANYDWTISNVNEWKSRGLPAEKAVLGVPFYSRPSYYSYAQLVAMDPANADRDCTTVNGAQQCYNGRPTIRRKTQWAMANAGGMMNWELSQDTGTAHVAGQRDLRHRQRPPSGPGQITGVGGKCVDVAGGAAPRTAPPSSSTACNGTAAQTVDRRRRRHAARPRQVPGRHGRTDGQRRDDRSCGTATAPAPRSGRHRATARCATRSRAGAWTRPATAPPTAPGCRSGTASAR